MGEDKLKAAIEALVHALTFESQIEKDDFYFNGIAKSFEVALEYAWKYLKLAVEEAGLEVSSPRDAMKQAARIGLIDDLDLWLNSLRIRSVAAHDYLGLSRAEYLAGIKSFLKALQRLQKKL